MPTSRAALVAQDSIFQPGEYGLASRVKRVFLHVAYMN
jgi:hypothetical protein